MHNRKKKNVVSIIAGLGLGAFCLVPAHGKTWTDASGKHTLEAEFVALKEGKITLRTNEGKVTTFPFKNLSKDDRSHAMKLALGEASTRPESPGNLSKGDVKINAKAQLVELSRENRTGKVSVSHNLSVEVELTEGTAAEAYAIGPATFEPIVVNGRKIEPRRGFHSRDFVPIKRNESEFLSEHPKDGIRVDATFAKMPKALGQIDVLKGSVKVLAGGTEKTVKLDRLLTRTTASIDHPGLKAEGFDLKFTRNSQGDSSDVGVSMKSGTRGFAGLKLIGADGKPVPNTGSGTMEGGGIVQHTVYATNSDLKNATLVIVLRNGKELDLPFEVKRVRIDR